MSSPPRNSAPSPARARGASGFRPARSSAVNTAAAHCSIVATVRQPSSSDRRAALGSGLAIAASVAALASAVWSLTVGLPQLGHARTYWEGVPPRVRPDPVALLFGYGDPTTWRTLRAIVGKGDRFALVATGDTHYDIGNYANYALLPAVHVVDPARANVVIYYRPSPSPRDCRSVGKEFCIVVRER